MDTKEESRELKKKVKSYQKAFKKYKVHPKSLFWATEKAAVQRYKELVADLDFEGKTILDVGCGTGGNSCYLADTYGCKVFGIDVAEHARARTSSQKLSLGR